MGVSSSSNNDLAVSLIDDEPAILLRSGDLLLTSVSDLEISLSIEPWHHVAIVVWHENVIYAFHKGTFVPVQVYLNKHPMTVIRHLDCIRPTGFDRHVYETALTVRKNIQTKLQDMSELSMEGYSAAAFLLELKLIREDVFDAGIPKPRHFSAESTFDRLRLVKYSDHISL